MDNPIIKLVFGTMAGLIVAIFMVSVVQAIGHFLSPLPAGIDPQSPEDQARMMELVPLTSKLFVVLAWFLGAMGGAAAALFISGKMMPGWIVAGFMVLASVATTQMFPHPVWMTICAVVLPIAAKLLADRLLVGRLTP